MDEGDSSEHGECDAEEDGDAAAEGFGAGVDFPSAGTVNESDFQGDGPDNKSCQPCDGEAGGQKAKDGGKHGRGGE
jgi:hypothetical protein